MSILDVKVVRTRDCETAGVPNITAVLLQAESQTVFYLLVEASCNSNTVWPPDGSLFISPLLLCQMCSTSRE